MEALKRFLLGVLKIGAGIAVSLALLALIGWRIYEHREAANKATEAKYRGSRVRAAFADGAVVVLRFDHSQRNVRFVVEDVIRAFRLAARDELSSDDDAALREADFLAKLRHLVPARLAERRRDELSCFVFMPRDLCFRPE